MSENPGAKIKKYTILYNVFISALFLAGGFKLIYEEYVFWGIFVILFGALFQYVTYLLLYGFGELVENSSYLKAKLCDSKEHDTTVLDRFIAPTTPQPATPQSNTDTPSKRDKNSGSQTGSVNPVVSNTPDMILCPKCGCEQKSTRIVCWKCGTKFQK